MDSGSTRLILQLGTNNWQHGDEFAPGSGILHEAHHHAYNRLPKTASFSIFPSPTQLSERSDVAVFRLDHDIPICESISPVSSYRWHAMSENDFAAYRHRLTEFVAAYMEGIERQRGESFGLAIAHHAFLNPVVLRNVLRLRAQQGKARMPLLCFVHGTALKMYAKEMSGAEPDDFPVRFLPFMRSEGVFDPSRPDGVDVCAAISNQQIDALGDVFPEFPRNRVLLSPNGYNQDVFHVAREPRDLYRDRNEVLAEFTTRPHEGSSRRADPVATDGGFDDVVVFCGKFADWKRLDVLLRAAAIYENAGRKVATVIVGSGPLEEQKRMQDLAFNELGLRYAYFVGPKPQPELAVLYNTADVGCFPSHKEPFGLVFIECMACGTPVIGANSGGPRDFVRSSVGTLVDETDDEAALARSLADAVTTALTEGWKKTKGQTAAAYAASEFSVRQQCADLLAGVDRLMARAEAKPTTSRTP